jgi:VWFA-related protein
LEKTDFTILDNEAAQLIDSFEVAFLPISMVICVQSSGRVEKLLPDVRKTAVIFTDLVLGEFGEAALIAFDNRVRLMEDFTNDHKKIGDALKRITIGSDAVRLSDGVYEAIRLLNRRPSEHRKIIVVVSESQENGSNIGLGETLRTAQLHDIMVYPIRLSTASARVTKWPKVNPDPIPPGVQARPVAPGQVATPTTMQQSRYDVTGNMIPIIIDLVRGAKNLIFSNPLELLAKGTGGKDYSPRTEDGLQESIAAIGEDIRSQYLLTYRPDNLNKGGIFHRIKVQVNYKGLKVRSRPGYFHGPAPVFSGEPADPAGTVDR